MSIRRVASILIVCGSTTSLAQPPTVDTQLRYEVRVFNAGHNDGWTPSMTVGPGTQVEVRAVVSYIGTTQVYGLGQIIFQPVVSAWRAGDSVITTPGTPGDSGIGPIGSSVTDPPGHVQDVPGAYGRISPWASVRTTTSSYYRGHVHVNPDGSGDTYLRIARADVTNWIGVGASSGSGTLNNTFGQGGVAAAQGTLGPGRPTAFPPQNTSLQNLVVFKFGFTLSSAPADRVRTLEITTPPLGLGRTLVTSAYGQPDTRWFTSLEQVSPGLHRSDVSVVNAVVHVVPSPGALGLLAAAGIAASRRRRR